MSVNILNTPLSKAGNRNILGSVYGISIVLP